MRKYKGKNKHLPYLKTMKSLLFTTITSLLTLISLSAQLTDDFSGPNLNSQVDWQGDTSLFRISEGQIQVYHPDASGNNTAQLYAAAPSSMEAFTTWRFAFQLNFSPSPGNFARVYLAASSSQLSTANAYYLQIGGISGSDDALVLYRQDSNGDRQAILSGQVGAVANDPASAQLQITRTPEGLWTLETDYSGGTAFQMEDAALDDTYNQLSYFGFYCRYTATRSERFFFDDVFVNPLYVDTFPPTLDSVFALDLETLQLVLSEPPGQNALQPERYSISGGIGQPLAVSTLPDRDHAVQLRLSQALQNLRSYTVQINGIADRRGNTAEILNGQFSVRIPQAPQSGDLLLSEVLFNPQSGGEDFIEVYNASPKLLDLNGLLIRNTFKISGKTEEDIKQEVLLLPGQYLAITDEVADIRARYPLPDTARFFANDLPTLDADQGNVSLFHNNQLLQSFDYSETMHNPLLDNNRGVSLERLSFLLPENDPENWASATAATGLATPGYANSQRVRPQIDAGNIFELERKTFSPDGDGFEDLLLLHYQTENPGYLANIQVFDAQGRPVKHLSRNESLASRGLITWDGTNQEGRKARTGIYVLWIELFTSRGDKKVKKLTCILASRH